MKSNITKQTKTLVVHALFCAVAYLLTSFIRIADIGGFLTFDAKDSVIVIASMIYGPISGAIISFVVSILEMVTISSTGFWGAIMNFSSSATFAVISSASYNYLPKFKKKISGAVIGLSAGVILTTLVMVVMNLLITPIYHKVPVSVVKSMLIPLLLPFNLTKTVLNASLVMLLYKSVSNILKRSGLTEKYTPTEIRFSKYTILIFSVSAFIAVVCVTVLLVSLDGKFKFI